VPSLEPAALPADGERRVIVVRNRNTRIKAGLCPEAHDLAASKLAAFGRKTASSFECCSY
jgi:hypothetical protein